MKTMQKIMASAMALTMAAGAGIGALADSEPIKTSGGSATVPVTISSSYTTTTKVVDPKTGEEKEVPVYDAPVFRVTVPASLPLTINADGSVTTPKADVFKIINGSAGSVKVTNVEFEDGGTWKFVPYEGSDFSAMKVGSNKLGLSLTANSKTVKTGDEGDDLKPNWTIAKNGALPIEAAAAASAVSKTVTENNAASVIFTVGWNAAPAATETFTFTIDDTEYTAVKGMTWGEWVASDYNTDGWDTTSDFTSLDFGKYIIVKGKYWICENEYYGTMCHTDDVIDASKTYVKGGR